jgi:hypothetical protein
VPFVIPACGTLMPVVPAPANLTRGASLDEVSAAVGHSSPTVTGRWYDHYVRKTVSAGMREGPGLTGATGTVANVVPMLAPNHGNEGMDTTGPARKGRVKGKPLRNPAKSL